MSGYISLFAFWLGGAGAAAAVVVFPGHVDYYAQMSETVFYYAEMS